MQDADVTKSLIYALKVIIHKSYKTILIKTFPKQLQFKKVLNIEYIKFYPNYIKLFDHTSMSNFFWTW